MTADPEALARTALPPATARPILAALGAAQSALAAALNAEAAQWR